MGGLTMKKVYCSKCKFYEEKNNLNLCKKNVKKYEDAVGIHRYLESCENSNPNNTCLIFKRNKRIHIALSIYFIAVLFCFASLGIKWGLLAAALIAIIVFVVFVLQVDAAGKFRIYPRK
jgi:hypothetical protein